MGRQVEDRIRSISSKIRVLRRIKTILESENMILLSPLLSDYDLKRLDTLIEGDDVVGLKVLVDSLIVKYLDYDYWKVEDLRTYAITIGIPNVHNTSKYRLTHQIKGSKNEKRKKQQQEQRGTDKGD